jgi:hypothetical protein
MILEDEKLKINKEFCYIGLGLGILVLTYCFSFVFTFASINDSFSINVDLLKYNHSSHENLYIIPENYELNMSGSTLVCPSNHCETEFKNLGVIVDEEGNFMDLTGDFKLIDNKINGQLDPEAKNLTEQMSSQFPCQLYDIQKGTSNRTTKYICSDKAEDMGSIFRKYNSTQYRYTFTASFELPSKHYTLNATEGKK